MKFYDRIKIFFKKHQNSEVETVIITEKQCPHCASRGMLIFKSDFETQKKDLKTNGKNT
jgi:hypothetical protein